MTDFNPIAGAILGSAQAQQQANVQSTQRVRARQMLAKNTAASEDQFEHQVESPEELTAIHDEPHQNMNRQKKPGSPPPSEEEDEEPHIDLQA